LQAVQKCSDARRARTEEQGVYGNTLSDEGCSGTQQMSVFQQPAMRRTLKIGILTIGNELTTDRIH